MNRNIDDAVPVTPKVELRRSNRVLRPPQRYSPSTNCLLLTEDGDLQCNPEAIQMDDST